MWAIYTKILAVSTTILVFRQNNVIFQQIRWQILHFSPNLLLLALVLYVMPAQRLPRRGVGRAATGRKVNGFLLSQE
jgi:hypothetical protein